MSNADYRRGRRDAFISILIFLLLGAAFVFFIVAYSTRQHQQVARAQEMPQLKVTQLAGPFNQVWMDRRFCASIWWSSTDVCSEAKGDELGIHASYKLDTYAAQAWVAVDGCTPTYCHLWIVEKLTNDKPGLSFVAIHGTVLLTVEPFGDTPTSTATAPAGPTSTLTATPTGTLMPTPTGTLLPTHTPTLTATPAISGTPTITPTPTPTPLWWQKACMGADDKALYITAGSSLIIPKRGAGEKTVCLIAVKVEESRLNALLELVSDTVRTPLNVGVYAPY